MFCSASCASGVRCGTRSCIVTTSSTAASRSIRETKSRATSEPSSTACRSSMRIDDGAARAAHAQQRDERVEEREARDVGVVVLGGVGARGRQPLGELGGQAQQLVGGRAELAAQRLAVEILREPAHDLDPRPVRRRGAAPAARPDHARAAGVGVRGERRGQPRLADARDRRARGGRRRGRGWRPRRRRQSSRSSRTRPTSGPSPDAVHRSNHPLVGQDSPNTGAHLTVDRAGRDRFQCTRTRRRAAAALAFDLPGQRNARIGLVPARGAGADGAAQQVAEIGLLLGDAAHRRLDRPRDVDPRALAGGARRVVGALDVGGDAARAARARGRSARDR